MFRFTMLSLAICTAFARADAPPPTAPKADPARVEFFESKIRPVLVEHCLSCHSVEAKKSKGALLLDTRAAMLKGGETGPAVVPGKPAASLLLKAMRHEADLVMPPAPKAKLSPSVLVDFTKWIEDGAVDPRDGTNKPAGIDWAKARSFYSFSPVRKPKSTSPSPIDDFILRELTKQKLAPAPLADKQTLLRRMTVDLTGLPPTPEEMAAFVADASPGAISTAIDRLLASSAYGERQARMWLDVARYAEDQAHTFGVKPNSTAWRYRDWVIDAFNSDLPYDRFVKLQIAADLYEKDGLAVVKDRSALGYFGLGAQYYKNTDAAKAAADELDDRVDTLTRGFLGLTVSCARCHDHKYDPIPTIDYYSIAGVFKSTNLTDLSLATPEETAAFEVAKKSLDGVKKVVALALNDARKIAALKQVDGLPTYLIAVSQLEEGRKKNPAMAPADIAKPMKLDPARLDKLAKFVVKRPDVPAMKKYYLTLSGGKDTGEGSLKKAADEVSAEVRKMLVAPGDISGNPLWVNLFGEKGAFPVSDTDAQAGLTAEQKKALIEQQKRLADEQKALPTLAMAPAIAEATAADMPIFIRGNPAKTGEIAPRRFLRILAGDEPKKFTQGSGRRELAEAIADKANPLTARVMVNRVWQQHFGRGIVGTPSNFGILGEAPSHPELLDDLAAGFVEDGWSIKKLHKRIMLSQAYQRSSGNVVENLSKDADNRWLWRMNRHRLDAEAFRDSLLAISGQLDRTFGGQTTDLNRTENTRRTIYGKISRHELDGYLRLFDFPDPNITADRRTETTVPQQQLFVLNSPFMIARSKAFAARVQKEAADDDTRIVRAWGLAYGRAPMPAEVGLAKAYLGAKDTGNGLDRWERLAQAILGSNEVYFID